MANSSTSFNPLIVSFGEMPIDFVPDVAGVSLAESPGFLKAPGGAPANVACAIRRLGGNSAFIGMVSDNEVAFLTQGDPQREDVVLSLWHDNLRLLVVTDGENGCRYFTKHFKGKVNGFSVKTVDTTGAGDAFVGAILVSLAKKTNIFHDEEKLREVLLLANACGAICVSKKGVIPALPTNSDALQLIKSKAKGVPLFPSSFKYFTKTCMLFSSLSVLVSILAFLLYKAK